MHIRKLPGRISRLLLPAIYDNHANPRIPGIDNIFLRLKFFPCLTVSSVSHEIIQMKKLLLVFSLIILASPAFIKGQTATSSKAPVRLKVYYFHPDERCPIDQSVEDNTRKVMQTNYQEKIKDGTIDFRVINTDDKANEKLASGFEINAQALYLVKVEKGKETKQDLTKFAFDNGFSNPLKFKKGLKDAIDEDLK
jgi:hypothetical protein